MKKYYIHGASWLSSNGPNCVTTNYHARHSKNCWVFYFHQSIGPSKWKQLHTGNQLTLVEQRSRWTSWCSYGPNCSHALHTTISTFISSTLLLKAKNYCTHHGTSWLTSWLSWAQEQLHIAMSIWSWLLSFITTNYIMQEITLNSIKVYHAGSNFEFHQTGNHVILVEQRSIWTLWCSYGLNCSYALHTTTTLIYQKRHQLRCSKWRTTTCMTLSG